MEDRSLPPYGLDGYLVDKVRYAYSTLRDQLEFDWQTVSLGID